MVMVDSAIYVAGRTEWRCETVAQTLERLRSRPARVNRFAWIGLYRPADEEITSLSEEFGLHSLAVEDAVVAHQRPKLDNYDDTMFLVLRPARYRDAQEDVEIGELHAFIGHDFVLTIRHAESPDLAPVRRHLEENPELLARGPGAVVHALLDKVVDDFLPVEQGLQNDLDEIEDEVFSGEAAVSERIYRLSRQVIQFQRASRPILDTLDALDAEFGGETEHSAVELRHCLRDVRDHASDVSERVESHRQLLSNILDVNASLQTQRQNEHTGRLTETSLQQNEDMKRISAWAAILFTPTLVATVYGMNFTHMPALDWIGGYPLALALMLGSGIGLYSAFRRRGWL